MRHGPFTIPMRTGDVFSRVAAVAGVAVSRAARFAFLLLAALAASSIFNEAFAESRDREDRLDLRGSIRESDQSSEQKNSATQSDPKLKTTSTGEKKDEHKPDPNRYFQVEFTIPFAYTNRAVRQESDVGGSAKGDFYAFPDLLLKWSHQTEWVKLTASLDLGTDRYSHEFDANGNAAIF